LTPQFSLAAPLGPDYEEMPLFALELLEIRIKEIMKSTIQREFIPSCKFSLNQFDHKQIYIHYIHQVQTESRVGHQKTPPLPSFETE
jgi:hypothetical protein